MKKKLSFLLIALCLVSTLSFGTSNGAIKPMGGPGISDPA
jgi:hypothetical protein